MNQKTKKLMKKRITTTSLARRVWTRISATSTDTYVSVEACVSVESWVSVEAWVSVEGLGISQSLGVSRNLGVKYVFRSWVNIRVMTFFWKIRVTTFFFFFEGAKIFEGGWE